MLVVLCVVGIPKAGAEGGSWYFRRRNAPPLGPETRRTERIILAFACLGALTGGSLGAGIGYLWIDMVLEFISRPGLFDIGLTTLLILGGLGLGFAVGQKIGMGSSKLLAWALPKHFRVRQP